MESGLESFHSSYDEFLSQIRMRVENGEIDDDDQPKSLRLLLGDFWNSNFNCNRRIYR